MGALKRIKDTLTRKWGRNKKRETILPSSGSAHSSVHESVESRSTRSTNTGTLLKWANENSGFFGRKSRTQMRSEGASDAERLVERMSGNRSNSWDHETLQDRFFGGQKTGGASSSKGSDGPARVDGSRDSGGHVSGIGNFNGSSQSDGANGSGHSHEQNNEEGKPSSELLPIQTPAKDTGSSGSNLSGELNDPGDQGEPWATSGDYYDNRRSWHGTGATVENPPVATSPDVGIGILDGSYHAGARSATEPERDDESDILPPHHRNLAGRDSIHADFLRKHDRSSATGSRQKGRHMSNKRSDGSHGGCRPRSHDQHKDTSDDDEDHDQTFTSMNHPTSFSTGGPQTSVSTPSNDRVADTPEPTDADGYKHAEVVEGTIPDWHEEWDEEWVEDSKRTSDDNYEEGFESFFRKTVSPLSTRFIRGYGRDFGRRFCCNTLTPCEKRALKAVRILSPTKNNPSGPTPSKSAASKSSVSKSTGAIKCEEKPIFVLGPTLGEWRHADDGKPTLSSETSLADWIDLKHIPTADAYKHALLDGKTVDLGPDLRAPFTKGTGNSHKDLETTNSRSYRGVHHT